MNEITKSQHCIVIRGGIQIWIPSDRVLLFDKASQEARSRQGMISFGTERINPADVVGVFTAGTMEETTRRKNGEWQCKVRGVWHNRGDRCSCKSADEEAKLRERFGKYHKKYGFYPPE